jgi:hypothetical protein
LPHRLNRSGGVPESDGPTSVDGSAGGGGAARVGEVSEGDSDDSVRGASGPWGQPLGPMVMRVVRRTASAPMGPVTTVIYLFLFIDIGYIYISIEQLRLFKEVSVVETFGSIGE